MPGLLETLRNAMGLTRVVATPNQSDPPHSPTEEILNRAHGHARSVEAGLPVAADGSALPWYTYPAIEYCNQIDALGLNVFEYGTGNSSLYWAHKGAQVWCVEHDPAWHETMQAKSAHLRGLALRIDRNAYAAAIEEVGESFDIVIIDGVWRNECAVAAVARLRESGFIILDNSDWYTDVALFLRSKGFFQIDFSGFGPINAYCWTTSFMLPFRSSLSDRFRQPHPVGGIEVFKGESW